ncbi:MAG: glycine C-acetyltransferase [Rhodospirillales bacterium]
MRQSATAFLESLNADLAKIEAEGLYKHERLVVSHQGAEIEVAGPAGKVKVVNLCANNYLGLADNQELVAAAKQGLDRYGLGMASVRFICGTEDQHRALEREIAGFLGFDDSILYAACFDANGGVFEPLFQAEDAIISDALNHASLIDGIRLCKARRLRYANDDMADLEAKLIEAADARRRVIVTDGVFSMDGTIAQLDRICDLADRYDALVLVDDCHGMGVLGEGGRGVLEHRGVLGRVDIVTGTLGKALGGSMGGFVAAAQPVVDLLRQRSRPYLFSNALAPAIVAAGRRAIELVAEGRELRARLWENAKRLRSGLEAAGFRLLPGEHPIVPVMIGDAALAQRLAEGLLARGIYVIGFGFPVVPKGQARVRTQVSAAHSPQQIDRAVAAFADAGRELGIVAP